MHLCICRFSSLDTNDIFEILGKTVHKVNQPSNDVQVDEIFPEMNMTRSNGPIEHVNKNLEGQVDKLLPKINMPKEDGLLEWANQHIRELAPDLFKEKKITRSLKGENQVLIKCYTNFNIKKYINVLHFLYEFIIQC